MTALHGKMLLAWDERWRWLMAVLLLIVQDVQWLTEDLLTKTMRQKLVLNSDSKNWLTCRVPAKSHRDAADGRRRRWRSLFIRDQTAAFRTGSGLTSAGMDWQLEACPRISSIHTLRHFNVAVKSDLRYHGTTSDWCKIEGIYSHVWWGWLSEHLCTSNLFI